MKIQKTIFISIVFFGLGYFTHSIINQSIPPSDHSKIETLRLDDLRENKTDITHNNLSKFDLNQNFVESEISQKIKDDILLYILLFEQDSQSDLLNKLFIENPKYAASAFNRLDESSKALYINDYVYHFGQRNPVEAIRWLEKQKYSLTANEFNNYHNTILQSLALKDPGAANQFLDSIESQHHKDQLILSITAGWAQKNIDKAFEMLSSLHEHGVSDQTTEDAYLTIMSQYAKIDPFNASQLLKEIESEDLQYRLLKPVIYALANKSLDEALSWSLNLNSERLRNEGVRSLINEMFLTEDSEHTLDRIIQSRSQISMNVLDSAFSIFSQDNPEIASKKMELLDEPSQAVLISSLASNWLNKNEAQASEWIHSQPDGSTREAAITAASEYYLHQENPSASLKWASSLEGPDKRVALLSTIASDTDINQLEHLLERIQLYDFSKNEKMLLQEKIEARIANASAPLIIPKR